MTNSLRTLLWRESFAIAGLCLLLAPLMPARAQATAGSIVGRVADPTQAVVPHALVKASNDATGLTKSGLTDAFGAYTLGPLPPGTYHLNVSKDGFTTTLLAGLQLSIDQKLRVDILLSVSPLSQLAEVTAQTPMLQTQSVETGAVIEPRQVQDLPLLGRNFLDLSRLTAGVGQGGGGNTLNLSSNGQREFANSILVDGIETSSNRNNDTANRPSVDSVEEFKVLTSSYSAAFGRWSGAVVVIQTAFGTNQFHAELYEFFRPNGTAARGFFAQEPSALKQHSFGATLGGPLHKNRTFFFLSYEGVRLRDAFSFLDSVPPAGQIRYPAGGGVDLSGLKDPSTGNTIPVFDPNAYAVNFAAQQFPGNAILASRLSPAGTAILQNFFPVPNCTKILHGWFDNFVSRQAYLYDSDTLDGRLDHVLSDRDRVSAIYHYGSFLSNTGDRFAGQIPVTGGGDADYGDHEVSRGQTISASEIHTLAPAAINELRFGYSRYRLNQTSLLNGQDLASKFGVGNVTLPGYPQTTGFPDIYLGFGAQTGGSTYKPLYFLDNNYQLSDNAYARRGKHDLKAGVQYRHLTSNPFFSIFPTGFQFYGGPGLSLTSDPNYSFYDPPAFYSNGGSDIADLLLGLPYSVNLGLQLTNPTTHSWEGSFYAEDSWRIRDGLVLLYGMRYEYFSPWTESANRAANIYVVSHQILLAGRGANSAGLIQPDRNNFAPRLGLAYRVAPRTVLRAGWGIFYSPENDAREDLLTRNYPFATQQDLFNNVYGGLPFIYSLSAGVTRFIPPPTLSGVSTIDPIIAQKATGAAQNAYMVDPNLRTGYSQMYNFTVQQEVAPNFTIEAGYVGSIGRNLPYAVGNINRSSAVSAALGKVQALYSDGLSSFNSFQAKAVQRLARGQSIVAAYTFAKYLDNGPAPFNLGHNLNSHNQPQDALNLVPEWALADNDITHNLVVSYVCEFPVGHGHRFLSGLTGWRQAILGGWQVNEISTTHTGLPVNVVRNAHDTGFEGLRPDVLRDPNLPSSERTVTHYFDTTAFSTGQFKGSQKHLPGNAGRNLVRGPGMANLDFSGFKQFQLQETKTLQLRFEFFNLTNTPHFANPVSDMSAGAFGSITQTVGNPRVAQFAAKVRF